MNPLNTIKILAAIFALRAKFYNDKWNQEDNDVALGESVAYGNAFDMLAYAAKGDLNCLLQFGWSDEAEELINKVGADIDFWELKDIIQKGK